MKEQNVLKEPSTSKNHLPKIKLTYTDNNSFEDHISIVMAMI